MTSSLKRKNKSTSFDSPTKKLRREFCGESQVYEKGDTSEGNDSVQCIQSKRCYPSRFVSFMYKLHLSILCLLRKLQCDNKYSSLSISFGDREINEFKDIVIRHQQKSMHVRVVDDHFMNYDITYSKLFREHQIFSLSVLFNSFVKYSIHKPFKFLNSVQHLIIYTNLKLDLGKSSELNYDRKKEFYPFKFEKVPIGELGVLQSILLNEITCNINCYRFSQDEETMRNLFPKLKLTHTMQKAVNDRKFADTFIDKIKEKFFNKLVFFTNQPCREELKSIISYELAKTNLNYFKLQEKVLCSIFPRPLFMYELNFLVSVLHSIVLGKPMLLNYESNDSYSYILVTFKKKVSIVKIFLESERISHNQMFPQIAQERTSNMNLNKQFIHFIDEFRKNENIKFFIIYTNTQLDLTNNNTLRGSKLRDPIQVHSIDTSKRRFKILHQLNGIDENSLYQISQNESIFNLLIFPKDEDDPFTDCQILEMKRKFLHKLILATNQPSQSQIKNIVENKISLDNEYSYDYELLQELALRWTESYKLGSITQNKAQQILYDIKNNISTYQKLQKTDIAAEIRFTNSVTGREGSLAFKSFLQYIVSGRGKKHLEDFRRSGLELNSVSGILHRAGCQGIVTLDKLHELLYDDIGRESHYLQTLRRNRLKLSTVSSFLNEAGPCAADALKNLFHLWFDQQGNKTKYLSTLEREKISLIHFSSMLHGGGRDVANSFKDLFNVLFDEQGNKKKYLILLEEKGLDLVNFSTILHCAGRNAAKAFVELYDVLFDSNGEKSFYLRILEENGINLDLLCPLLNGSGPHAGSRFKSVFHLFFDKEGNKSHYLINMEKKNISLVYLNSVLSGARSHVIEAFKDLYHVWFDDQGNETHYLRVLEENGIDLHRITTILFGSGARAAQAFKNLYHLLFDENGQKSVYLRTLLKNGISLTTMGYMLTGTKTHASHTYKVLHRILFDDQGNKSERLEHLEKAGINLSSIALFLKTAKSNIESAFDDLYKLWFNEDALKTRYVRILENNGLTISRMATILHASGCDAAKAYKSLFECWFEDDDSKTKFLKIFEENGLNLRKIATLLYKVGKNSSQVFMEIYNLWFDEEGNKVRELTILEQEGVSLIKVKTLFRGLGTQIRICFNNFFDFWMHKDGTPTNLYSTFKKNNLDLKRLLKLFKTLKPNSLEVIDELYHMWFTPEGVKTEYTSTLEKNEVELSQIIEILRKTSDKAPKIFIETYNLWFDSLGNKTQHLIDLENKGMSLKIVAETLAGSGKSVVDKFMDL
ncbi:hypothetical protein QAD02_016548 [Eretmocerus hayati]|uniref:Uncharacterized protein n=1 Tax=Eretmocerus hayati TaxID=131215 RepID=A0ACC2PCN5_9HYME|nr:hypothetical protein QAD02_016548 [Eretmocerus hayati]